MVVENLTRNIALYEVVSLKITHEDFSQVKSTFGKPQPLLLNHTQLAATFVVTMICKFVAMRV